MKRYTILQERCGRVSEYNKRMFQGVYPSCNSYACEVCYHYQNICPNRGQKSMFLMRTEQRMFQRILKT